MYDKFLENLNSYEVDVKRKDIEMELGTTEKGLYPLRNTNTYNNV